MRPAKINKIYDDILDVYRICHLGIGALHINNIQQHFLSLPPDSTMALTSSFPGEDANFTIIDVIQQIQSDQKKSPQTLTRNAFITLTRVFVIYSFDVFKESGLYDKYKTEPMVQFFRHIRNGCAHNNKFYFQGKTQLEFPAEWRGKKVDILLEGSDVIESFFKEGDFIILLDDLSLLK
jgi:hypothetical protein